MSNKLNGVNYGKTVQQRSRRDRALKALQNQLKSGLKRGKGKAAKMLDLTDSDKNRINKEIEVLKSRL